MEPSKLDYETTSQYDLTILVSDPYGLLATDVVTVDIKDVNESPVIQNLPHTVSISENVMGKITVLNIDVTDQDGDMLFYTVSTWPSTTSLFAIDSTGKI